MYLSRIFFPIGVIVALVSWVGFKFPEHFIYLGRSAALTKAIGENASKKLAKYFGAPATFIIACFLMWVAIDQEITIRAAEKGDAAAQYELADNFYEGNFQRTDFKKAVSWYLRAARKGHPEAGLFIDTFIENPGSVAEEDADVFTGYRFLAEAGIPRAQYRLGECYHQGLGTPKNETEAVKWYTSAAESGYANAFGMLGYCYANGIGTEKNIEEAIRWYELSADQGSAYSQTNLGLLYLNHFRDDAHRMREAKKLFKKASLKNDTDGMACYCMGYMILHGIETTKDPALAFVWFSLAADRGSVDGRQMRGSIGDKLTPAQLKWAQEFKDDLDTRNLKTKNSDKSSSAIRTGPVKTRTVVEVFRPKEY